MNPPRITPGQHREIMTERSPVDDMMSDGDRAVFIIREVEVHPNADFHTLHVICYLQTLREEGEVARTVNLASDSAVLRRQRVSAFRWMMQASASFHRRRLFDCTNQTVYRPGQTPIIVRMSDAELELMRTP